MEKALMTPEEVQDKVFTIVSEQMAINKAEITRETSFVNDLNADSLDIVELVMEFEDNFEMAMDYLSVIAQSTLRIVDWSSARGGDDEAAG